MLTFDMSASSNKSLALRHAISAPRLLRKRRMGHRRCWTVSLVVSAALVTLSCGAKPPRLIGSAAPKLNAAGADRKETSHPQKESIAAATGRQPSGTEEVPVARGSQAAPAAADSKAAARDARAPWTVTTITHTPTAPESSSPRPKSRTTALVQVRQYGWLAVPIFAALLIVLLIWIVSHRRSLG